MNALKLVREKSTILLLIVAQLFLFIGFGFTNSIIFSVSCGAICLLVVIFVSYKEFKKENAFRLALFVFPLLIYSVLAVIGRFSQYEFPIYIKVLVPFSFLIFLLVGYFFALNKEINFSFLLSIFLVGVAIISIVNLIITLSYLGPLYAYRTGSNYLYKDGICSHYTIARGAYALVGFNVEMVSVEYYALFPFILLSTGVMLFFKSPRTQTKQFIFYSVLCLVGVISLALVFSKYLLLPLVIILVIMTFVVGFFKNKQMQTKTACIIYAIIASIGVLLFILVIINAQYGSFIYRFTHSNSFLNKVFNNNTYMESINFILSGVFTDAKLFGFTINHSIFYNNFETISGDLLVNQFIYSGVFSFIFFAIALGFAISNVYKTLRINTFESRRKYVLPITFLLVFFGYTLFSTPAFISMFGNDIYQFFLSGIWMGVLATIGYFIKESEGLVNA